MSRKKGPYPFFAAFAVCAAIVSAGCGKKGPPLPPLLKVPVAPAGFTADRRADTVDLHFAVPAANTDGTRPANVDRVDVYGFTGSPDVTDAQLLKHGTRIGSVPVKAPRDPNEATEPEEEDKPPDTTDEEMEGTGLDQGARAAVEETLTGTALSAARVTRSKKEERALIAAAIDRPLLGPPPTVPSRTYVSVGINKSGKKGALSPRVAVPLVPAPPPPPAPTIAYDEKAVTVTWTPIPGHAPIQAPADKGVLPAQVIGLTKPTIGYHVYDVPPRATAAPTDGRSDGQVAAAAPGRGEAEARLTKDPTGETSYQDTRIEWGAERCYEVRSVETYDSMSVESAASPAACVKLVDTFPPAAPLGLTAVASAGAISLIWQPNSEKDLAGYIVLRGETAAALAPVMAAPIQDTTFKDTVTAGTHYVYAVRAVDKAGNKGPASATVEETAR